MRGGPSLRDGALLGGLLAALCLLQPTAARALDPSKAITQYQRDTWTLAQGLPHSSVNRISQDSAGYLWMSTFGGAVRFDGVRFQSVALSGGSGELLPEAIADTLEDQAGTRWFATSRGLLRADGASIRLFSREQGLPGNGVQTIALDPGRGLLVGTGRGLAVVDPAPPFRVTPVSPLLGADITCFLHDRAGRLWVGTRQGLWVRLKSGSWERARGADLETVHVWSVVEDRTGALWIATRRGGLVSWANGKTRRFTRRDGLAHDVVRALLIDREGSLWIGTAGGGLNRRRDDRFEHLTAAHGDLPSDVVRSLFEDREGNVWVGTAGGGLTRLSDRPFTNITKREGLPDESVWTTVEDTSGTLWIGTNGGLAGFRKGRVVAHPETENTTPIVLSLLVTRAGRLLVGTYEGLFERHGERLVRLDRPGDLPNEVVRCLVEGASGSVWIGTEKGIAEYHPHSTPAFSRPHGAPDANISVIRESRSGGLWLGLERGGILRSESDTFISQAWADRLGTIRDILEDERGVVWIAGMGLGRFENGRLIRFGAGEGFADRRIHALLEDGHGRLWMSTNTGIYRVLRSELDAFAATGAVKPRFEVFRENDGVTAAEGNGGSQPAAWKARDGRLWFATIKGLTGIDPATATAPEAPVVARIEQALIDGGRVEPGASLPVGARRIEFEYTALTLTSPEQQRFRYRLEPVDAEWSDAGTRRSVAYAGLRPGAYRFRVAATGRDGDFLEDPAPFDFVVVPYIYERPLVRWGVLFLGVAGLLGMAGLRVRGLRRREAELERVVAEKTRDLERLASEDPLTGLANRREFDRELDREILRSRRTGQPLALVMLDVDHFKAYNDAYGHPQGDECLRRIAQVLTTHGRRAGDLVARLGGEEFAVLLPDMEASPSVELARRLLDAMGEEKIPHVGAPPLGYVTVSIGVATVRDDALQSLNAKELVEEADEALYEAKAEGRNRVVARQLD